MCILYIYACREHIKIKTGGFLEALKLGQQKNQQRNLQTAQPFLAPLQTVVMARDHKDLTMTRTAGQDDDEKIICSIYQPLGLLTIQRVDRRAGSHHPTRGALPKTLLL